MNYAILAIIILIFNIIIPLFLKSVLKIQNAYQWWYIPWFGFLYVVIMYIVFHFTNVYSWPGFSMLYAGGMVETCYVLVCQLLWYIVGLFLRRKSVHEKLIPLFRNAFALGLEDGAKILPFPYFIDHENIVRSRVGKLFYRRLLGTAIFTVALIYAIYFILMHYLSIPFYLLSAFGLFGLIPLIDYYLYLMAEVPEEKEEHEEKKVVSAPSDLEKLWKEYTGVFTNYSVAWKRKFYQDPDSEKNNSDMIENLIESLTDVDISKGIDGFLENSDLTQAIARIEPLFNWEEQNGRLVLVTFDIPNLFNKTSRVSYLKDIATKMKAVLRREDLVVYDQYTSEDVLDSSIVVTSLNVLTQRIINEEWLKRIGLVVIINFLDKSVSNLYECRKFSLLLDAINNQYQMLFVTPLLRDVEKAMKNNWVTSAGTVERCLKQSPHGYNQFFIGYNFEDYVERYKSILPSLPSEPLSAISEMAPIALSYKVGGEKKIITPVHFFDLAYTNIVESNEELGKFYKSDNYPVRNADINNNIYCHLLPVDVIKESQIFSVIFDQDNNAPSAYNKWIHLGTKENFSVVISKPYLFRDYFNANHNYFINVPFIALQPLLSKSRVTLAMILLNMLQKSVLDEQQLRGLLQGYCKEEEILSLAGTVQQLFTTYFSHNLASRLRTNHFVDFDGSNYLHRTTFEIDYSDNVSLSYLDRITIMDESDNVLFVIIRDLMYQNFDKGQIHSFLGKPYEIRTFEEGNKVLRVRAANTQAHNVVFYKPVHQVEIGGEHRSIEDMENSNSWNHPTGQALGLDFYGFETQVSVVVKRWYAFNRYSVYGCTYRDVEPARIRSYSNGKVLKVSFRYLKKKEYIDRIDDIRKGLQILIYEAMQSVFPHHAQYLIISSLGEGDRSLPWIFNQCICQDKDEPGMLSYYFTEDAHIDLGLIGALAHKDIFGADYLFRFIYDYLLWLTEGNPVAPDGYDEYLFATKQDKLSFLKYGKDSLPSYFDIDLLINFIRDFFCEKDKNVLQGVTERNKRQDVFGTCDFCRDEMKNSEMQRLTDGRMRCPKCSDGAIDRNEQFQQLCSKVKMAFQTHLNIDFSRIDFKAKLVPAVELHKEYGYVFSITNGYDARKIVGLASDADVDTIYVENGYKADKTFGIIAHEMTHIWEYNNEEFKKVCAVNNDLVEGLAVWTDLFLCEKEGMDKIEELRNSWLSRDDEYGRGLRFIMDNCPNDPYSYIRDKAKSMN